MIVPDINHDHPHASGIDFFGRENYFASDRIARLKRKFNLRGAGCGNAAESGSDEAENHGAVVHGATKLNVRPIFRRIG
jgi:hypothetical protein